MLLATTIDALLSAAAVVEPELVAAAVEALEAALVAETLDAALVETVGLPMRIGPPILKWFWHW